MFIPPQLCTLVSGRQWLIAPGYVAEPKLDGQRIQLHVQGGRTVAAFTRLGQPLLQHRGLAWLTSLGWPFEGAVLDGELCAAYGIEGFYVVRTERERPHGQTQVTVFDCLGFHDRPLLAEAWTVRRHVLEELLARPPSARVRLIPTTTNAQQLWAQWTTCGGEGIVLKDPAAPYRPGERTRAWLKLKARAGGDAPLAILEKLRRADRR
jgi:bifunctional non-homologous end joining protein LigD